MNERLHHLVCGPGVATPRAVIRASAFLLLLTLFTGVSPLPLPGAQPEAIAIHHDPQFFIDDYLVDNRWGVDYLTETVTRLFHQPQKDHRNPVIPENGGYLNVLRDEQTGLFRMWYEQYWYQSAEPLKYTFGIGYAESTDGLHWKRPRIGKYKFKGTRDNNIVLLGPGNGLAQAQFLLEVPAESKRGYKYVMLWSTYVAGENGLHLVGSQNGIDWDPASDTRISPGFVPDTHTSIVWDPKLKKFVCFTRAVNIYTGEGQRRKISRLEHTALWEPWPILPQNILLPDTLDARTNHNYFYGMPTRYYAGIYWGFLWPYQHQKDIFTELAFSRDGIRFDRLADRPHLVDPGPRNSWDAGMVLASPSWVEVGDEWWIYYSGSRQQHDTYEQDTGIGLLRVRKEGLVSLHSPPGGGHVVTRLLRWPGGKLLVNADLADSQLTVRVTDYDRQPLKDFDSQPSLPLTGDSTRHEVQWEAGDLRDLQGRLLRLEFFMNGQADLYTFLAAPSGER